MLTGNTLSQMDQDERSRQNIARKHFAMLLSLLRIALTTLITDK